MKSVITVFALFSLLFFTGCNSSLDENEPKLASDFKQLTIPVREHGYSNFETTVIDSATTLVEFLNDVNLQEHWNDKETFVRVLENRIIDFKIKNLILYRITEGSGSIALTPQEPIKDGNNLLVTVVRDVPAVGTADMSYSCLAYVIDKNISAMIFYVGNKEEIVLNSHGGV